MVKQKDYQWHTQSVASSVEVIDCPVYDPNADFKRDKTGFYVLVRPDFTSMKIEVAVCDQTHKIVAVFKGSKCQDVYEAIFAYEQRKKYNWFSSKGHIAYIGKELKKAEIALALGQNNYFQE